MARFDRTIPPGGEGTITLEVNTKDKQGNIHQTARVFSNDPKNSELTIGMKGNVWAPIHLRPKYAQLAGTLGDKIETVVHIMGQKKDPLIVQLAWVSIPDKVEVELTEIEKGRIWEVTVENKAKEQTTYKGQIKLTTNYPEKPEMVIRITGHVRPPVEVRPKTLNFGRLAEERLQQLKKKGKFMSRPLMVVLNRGNDLKVNKVELEKSLFQVVTREMKPGRMFQLQVQAVFEKLKKGVNTDRLKIYTNQKDSEVLEVPIRFEIL